MDMVARLVEGIYTRSCQGEDYPCKKEPMWTRLCGNKLLEALQSTISEGTPTAMGDLQIRWIRRFA